MFYKPVITVNPKKIYPKKSIKLFDEILKIFDQKYWPAKKKLLDKRVTNLSENEKETYHKINSTANDGYKFTLDVFLYN